MSSPRPAVALLCGGLLAVLSGGCKRQKAPPPAGAALAPPSVASSALPVPEPDSHCRKLPGFALSLDAAGPADARQAEPEEADDDLLLPFGVDLGAAVPTTSGFAVAGIRGAGEAFVALLGEQAARRVDLGVLQGDPEPPALASQGDRVLFALRSTDAAGFTVKLGEVKAGAPAWGHELSGLGAAVSSLGLALSGDSGVLVLSDARKQGSKLLLGRFAPQDLKRPFSLQALEPSDVELPRVLARPGGFWLAWVRTLPEDKPSKTARALDAGVEDPEERELLALGLHALEVVKLDLQGQPLGAPLRVGQPRRQVLLFDAAPLASGKLLLATRADSATPGAEGGAITLSEVGLDGSVHEELLDDGEIGAGVPALLADPLEKSGVPWLAVSAPSDATRLGLAHGEGTQLQSDPRLGRAEVIAVRGGRFLTQRARGRGAELALLGCEWPAEPGRKE